MKIDVNSIEELKRRHAYRLVRFGFLSVFNRYPLVEETERYLMLLKNGISVSAMIEVMRVNTTTGMFDLSEVATPSAMVDAIFCINDELSQLSDEDFLEAVYLRFLGRGVDNEGKGFFLKSLSNGESRMQLIMDITNSAEGQRYKLKMIAPKDYIAYQYNSTLSSAANIFVSRFFAASGVE